MKGSVDMKRFDLIIVGAGPSGLSAAIEAAKRGLEVVVFDENEKPGGQLFKHSLNYTLYGIVIHKPYPLFLRNIVGSPAYFVSLPFSVIPIFSSHSSNSFMGLKPRISLIVDAS